MMLYNTFEFNSKQATAIHVAQARRPGAAPSLEIRLATSRARSPQQAFSACHPCGPFPWTQRGPHAKIWTSNSRESRDTMERAVDQDTTPRPLDTLFHNADKARNLAKVVTTKARELSLDDAKEILHKLQAALDDAEEILATIEQGDDQACAHAEEAVAAIRQARDAARRCHERKQRWALQVETNADAILEGARKASVIHRRLRQERRKLNATDVSRMRDELAEIESEAMSAWGVIRQFSLPRHLERRLSSATRTLANALGDCETTLKRKTEWEQAIATNVAAVEAELSRLETLVGTAGDRKPPDTPGGEDVQGSPDPPPALEPAPCTDSQTDTPSTPPMEDQSGSRSVETAAPPVTVPDLVAQARKIEQMLRFRRPIDRDNRARLNNRLADLVNRGGFSSWVSPHVLGARSGKSDEPDARVEDEVVALLEQVERTLGAPWDLPGGGPKQGEEPASTDGTPAPAPAEPAAGDAGTTEAHATEAATSSPPPQHASSSDATEGTHDMLTPEKIKAVQEALRRARRLLETAAVPHSRRRELWARFRHANATFRSRKSAVIEAAAEHFDALVKEAHRLASDDTPAQARKWIQKTQKALAGSPLGRAQRAALLESLREAWATAARHQQELRDQQKRHRKEALDRLGNHFMRWQKRKSGITNILERLNQQIETYRQRQQTSTSIGYRVVAEQRMAELKARIEELEGVLGELEAKIEDVAPRLEAAGWVPPEEPHTDDGQAGGAPEDASAPPTAPPDRDRTPSS